MIEAPTTMVHTLLDLGVDCRKSGSGDECCLFHLAVEIALRLVVEKMLVKVQANELESRKVPDSPDGPSNRSGTSRLMAY